jgi:hypothetical protein
LSVTAAIVAIMGLVVAWCRLPPLGGLVDESPANFYLFFYSGGILKIRRAKKKRKNKRTTD